MVRRIGKSNRWAAAAARTPPGSISAYVLEAGFSRGGLEYRRKKKQDARFEIDIPSMLFFTRCVGGIPDGGRRCHRRRPSGGPDRQSHRSPAASGPAASGPYGIGVWRRRGPAIWGLEASGSGGIGVWRAGSGGVGVWWCWWSGSSGPGPVACGPGGFRVWGWVGGLGGDGVRGVRQTAVDGQGRRRGHRHTRHSCGAGEGHFDCSDRSQAAAGAGPAGGAGRPDGAGGHAE